MYSIHRNGNVQLCVIKSEILGRKVIEDVQQVREEKMFCTNLNDSNWMLLKMWLGSAIKTKMNSGCLHLWFGGDQNRYSRTRIYRTWLYRIKVSVPTVQNNKSSLVYIGWISQSAGMRYIRILGYRYYRQLLNWTHENARISLLLDLGYNLKIVYCDPLDTLGKDPREMTEEPMGWEFVEDRKSPSAA